MTLSKSYWLYALFIIVLASGFFILFKKVLPNKIFPESVKDSEHIVVDEWMQKAMEEDSLEVAIEEIEKRKTAEEIIQGAISSKEEYVSLNTISENKKKVVVENDIQRIENTDILDENIFLNHFYHSLQELQVQPKSRKVRIAYFGDSMTDGDMIVQDLRQLFQSDFGGKGVGFVSITSESSNSRGSIKHSFSRNWSAYTYMKNYDSLYPFGVNGQVFYSIDTINPTTLHLSSGLYAKGEPLQNIELYYGKSNNQHAKIRVVTPKDTVELKLNPEKKLNRLELTKNSVMSLDLDFIDSDSIPFYGVDLKYPYGIQVDNYSNRGNSGLPITQLNTQLMHDFQEALNYDLIILHYGTNVLSSTTRNYSWYQSRMERVVDHLRNIFPKASIMVVSIADKSTKYETEMQTDSSVVRLLNLQRKYAENKQTGFVNLFQLMGGENSMIKWVEEEPERANKDYTHFNHRGAKEIAQMIYKEIIQGFQDYIRKQKLLEEEKEYLRVQDSIQKVEEKRRLEQKMEEEFELKKDSVHVSEN